MKASTMFIICSLMVFFLSLIPDNRNETVDQKVLDTFVKFVESDDDPIQYVYVEKKDSGFWIVLQRTKNIPETDLQNQNNLSHAHNR